MADLFAARTSARRTAPKPMVPKPRSKAFKPPASFKGVISGDAEDDAVLIEIALWAVKNFAEAVGALGAEDDFVLFDMQRTGRVKYKDFSTFLDSVSLLEDVHAPLSRRDLFHELANGSFP